MMFVKALIAAVLALAFFTGCGGGSAAGGTVIPRTADLGTFTTGS